ncbi:DUF6541 family protein [Microbacterium indicum]|uniref:DUF6541 family protein n=1 Tax=Microbacterium indicum TaxID=358100 RepID=UPI00041B0192|nr:DUF6541 family protein [Microbacterium indicum]
MTWLGALPAALAALVVVLAPGLVATAPLRAGLLARAGLAGLAGVGSWGVAGALAGAAGLSFRAWQALVPAVVFALIAWGVRRLAPALVITPARLGRWAAPAWILGAAVVAIVAFAGVPDADRISQTYDNVFHLSATTAILDGFSPSPFTLRSLIETADSGLAYYPDGWHLMAAATVQLSGSTVAVAFNALWLVVAVAVWLPGVAWLAQVILPGRSAGLVGLVALPLGAAFGAYPYALLAWGTIYPTFLAHALLPAAVAVTIVAIRGALVARHRARAVLVAAIAVLLAVGAIGVAHPRVLATWALIGIPFVVAVLAGAYRRAVQSGGRRRTIARRWLLWSIAVAVAAFAAAFAYAVVGLGLFDEPLADRLNGPQALSVQPLWQGIVEVVMQQSLTTGAPAVTWPAIPLAIVVAAGAIAAWRRRGARWIVVAAAVTAALFVLAAGSDDPVTKILTGTWYKDRFRLAAAIPVLAVPLAALGTVSIVRWLRGARRAGEKAIALAVAAAIAVSSALTLGLTGMTQATADAFALPTDRAAWEVVSQRQIDFQRDVVASIVPDDQRVLGDPWDGSALTGLYAGREPVFPHVNGQWDPARLVLAWHLQDIDTDPAVCAALDELRVRYVLYDPHEFGGGDPSGNHFPGPHAAVERGLFTEVASDGGSTLYEITQCGPLP